jgi:hypothetical protein
LGGAVELRAGSVEGWRVLSRGLECGLEQRESVVIVVDQPVLAEVAGELQGAGGFLVDRPLQRAADVVELAVDHGQCFAFTVGAQVRDGLLDHVQVMLEMAPVELVCL